MEKEYSNRTSGEYYSLLKNCPQMKLLEGFNKSLGKKRYGMSMYSSSESSYVQRPDYPETDISNIMNPFDENSSNGSFRLTSFSESMWEIYIFDFTSNVFSNLIEFEGKEFWIGTIENTSLNNGLQSISNNDFMILVKSGLYKIENNEVLVKSNLQIRSYDLGVGGNMYFKIDSLNDSHAMNIGKSNYKARTQRINEDQMKIFIAVKYATVLFSKIPATQVVFSDWNNGREIDIDATEYDVILASPQFSTSLQRKYQSVEILSNTNDVHWTCAVYDSSLISNTFSHINQGTVIPRTYVVGLEDRKDLYLNVNNTHSLIATTPLIRNINMTSFDYYDDPDSFHIGNGTTYASAYITSDTVIPISIRNTLLVKNTILSVLLSDIIPNWRLTTSNAFYNSDGVGSDIYNFFSDPDSGIKASLNSTNNAATFYSPSTNIGPQNKSVSMAMEFMLPDGSSDVYLGVINQISQEATVFQGFEYSNDLRVNLLTGQIEIQGQNVGTPLFFEEPSVVILTLTYLDNGNILANIGTSENNMQQFTLQTMGGLTDPRFYITGNNIVDGSLGTFKMIPIEALIGETNDIPVDVIYPASDISNMGNIFDENSAVGSFEITSNSLTEWTVLVLDASYNVLAGQTIGEGVEMYMGVLHSSILQNGLNTINNTDFDNMSKSGVNFKFTPTFTQKIFKENVFSRDFDMFIYPTLYFKLTDVVSSTCFSIGSTNYQCRNIKLQNTPNKFFIAVRKGKITFSKISASQIVFADWDDGREIDIDASEYDVILTSPSFPNSTRKYQSFEINTNSNNTFISCLVHEASIYNQTYSFIEQGNVIPRTYVVGLEDQRDLYLNVNNTYALIASSPRIRNIQKIVYDYFDGVESFHIGNGDNYASAFSTPDTIVPLSMRNVVIVKNTFIKITCSSQIPNWNENVSYVIDSSDIQGSDIYDFFTDPDSGIKANIKSQNSSSNEATYYFPSINFAPGAQSDTVIVAFEFYLPTNGTISMGVVNQSNPLLELTSLHETSTYIRTNLNSGQIQLNGTDVGTPLVFNQPKIVLFSLTYLQNDNILVNVGISEIGVQTFTILAAGSFTDPRFYITGTNLVNGDLGVFKQIPIEALVGETNNIPTEYIYPPSNISNIGNLFNSASGDSGNMNVSSNDVNLWSLYVGDNSFYATSCDNNFEGLEFYIGYLHNSMLSNGLHTLTAQDFDLLIKSGVNYKLQPSLIKNIFKENIFSRNFTSEILPEMFLRLRTGLSGKLNITIGSRLNLSRIIEINNTANKFFIAVRKGNLTIQQQVSTTYGSIATFSNTERIEVDATDMDILFMDHNSVLIGTATNYECYLQQLDNLLDISSCDMYVFKWTSEPNYYQPIAIGSNISEYLIKNISKTSCTLNKDGIELAVGNTLNTLVEPHFYFSYRNNHETVLKKNIYLGSSNYQNVSVYIDTDINLTTAIKFGIRCRSRRVYSFKKVAITENQWYSQINYFTELSAYSPLSILNEALTNIDYNKKIRISSTNLSTIGTVFFPSVYVGSGSMVNPVSFCFECYYDFPPIIGILNQTQINGQVTQTIETSNLAKIDMATGICTINGIESTKPISLSAPAIFVISCRKIPSGLVVSIGTSGENANQAVLIPNTNFDNVCLYITTTNATYQKIASLKRLTLPGLTGYVDEIPVDPQLPPSSNNPSFEGVFSNYPDYTLDESFILTSTANSWQYISWKALNSLISQHLCSYGEYEFTPFSGQTMNWFVGTVSNSGSNFSNTTSILPLSNTIYTLSNTQHSSAVKWGIMYNGSTVNFINKNSSFNEFQFENQSTKRIFTEVVKRIYQTVSGGVYRVGNNTILGRNLSNIDPFASGDYFYHVIGVKYGSIKFTKKNVKGNGLKLGFNENNLNGINRITNYTTYGVNNLLIKGMNENFSSTYEYGFFLTNNDTSTDKNVRVALVITAPLTVGYNNTSLGNYEGMKKHATYLSNDPNGSTFVSETQGNRNFDVPNNATYFVFIVYGTTSGTSIVLSAYGTVSGNIVPYYTATLSNYTLNWSNIFIRLISEKKFGLSTKTYNLQIGDGKEMRTYSNPTVFIGPDAEITPYLDSANNNDITIRRITPDLWFSDSFYQFDGNSVVNSVLNNYFLSNSQTTTRKLLLRKSHVGSSVTFRSSVLNLINIIMQYEITSNVDIYVGIVTDTLNGGSGNWEYLTTFTDPNTMIAYVNLTTLQAVIGATTGTPLSYSFSSNKMKIIDLVASKSTDTANFTKFDHYIAPSISKSVQTGGHGGGRGYRYVITCQNVTDNNIIMFNTYGG
jgi:hypothetical protein